MSAPGSERWDAVAKRDASECADGLQSLQSAPQPLSQEWHAAMIKALMLQTEALRELAATMARMAELHLVTSEALLALVQQSQAEMSDAEENDPDAEPQAMGRKRGFSAEKRR